MATYDESLDLRSVTWLVPGVRMTSPAAKRRSLLKLCLALALSCSLAYADASGGSARKAKQLIESIEATPEQRKVAVDPLEKAKSALERSQNARGSQDSAHADLLAELALEWAEAARDLTRAAELEKKASLLQEKAAKIEAKSVRAMTIVEAAVARRGRAQVKLEALEAGQQPKADAASPKAAKEQAP